MFVVENGAVSNTKFGPNLTNVSLNFWHGADLLLYKDILEIKNHKDTNKASFLYTSLKRYFSRLILVHKFLGHF